MFEYRCKCGAVGWARYSDLRKDVGNIDRSCKSCSMRIRMNRVKHTDTWKKHQRAMSEKALGKPLPQYTATENEVLNIMRGAKLRCTKNHSYYKNYNGRGIQFLFKSAEDAMRWVTDNLGPRPSKQHSIDRIDNDGNYEPGNLRWATRKEQNLNKRAYKVGAMGVRIRRLQMLVDYSYESLRTFIKQGLSDEEIINKRKWDGCGKHKSSSV